MPATYGDLIAELRERREAVALGGPQKARERHTSRGKLLARDRIDALLDPGSPFLEVAPLAAVRACTTARAPAAGVIAGIGLVHGRHVMVVANDATVKGGTYYPMTVKKHLRAQEIALENRLPCIYLVDSGGAFLPHAGRGLPRPRPLRAHLLQPGADVARAASRRSPRCSARAPPGGAYVPAMSDETVIVRNQGTIFLGGPPLVKAATGEVVSAEDLGGGVVHARRLGRRRTTWPRTTSTRCRSCATSSRRCPRRPRCRMRPRGRRRAASDPPPSSTTSCRSSLPTAVRRARDHRAGSSTAAASTSSSASTARPWSPDSRASTGIRSASSRTTACCSRSRRSRARTSSSCATSAASRCCSCRTSPGFMVGPRVRGRRHRQARRQDGQRGGLRAACRSSPSSSAARSAPATTRCAGGRTRRASCGCGRARGSRSWAGSRRHPCCRPSGATSSRPAAAMVGRGRGRVPGADPRAVRDAGQPLLLDRAALGRRHHRPGRHPRRRSAWRSTSACARPDRRRRLRRLPDVSGACSRTVLIANRGEIACRIIRTLRAPRHPLGRRLQRRGCRRPPRAPGRHAVRLGPAAAQSYLDIDAVLAAAQRDRRRGDPPRLRLPRRERRVRRARARRPASCSSARRARRSGSWATRSRAKAPWRRAGVPTVPGVARARA